jgi:hypothetical protein
VPLGIGPTHEYENRAITQPSYLPARSRVRVARD